MNEIARIQDQLQRAFDGNAWHGPSLSALLADVSPAKAAAKPVPAAHSIWVLVLHITAWQRVVVRRLAGEEVREIPLQEDFPTIQDVSETAWRKAKDELATAHRQLWEAMGRLSEAQLSNPVPGQRYSVYGMLHGVIQHNLYHAGQIALLKKF
jgi:uncharacterized damage-inducible protein DinB